MSCWRKAFIELAAGEDIFACWYTKEGGYIYMYVPEIEEIGEDGFQGKSKLQFGEIEKIDILRTFKHGNIDLQNDLAFVKAALNKVEGISVIEAGDVLSVELA